MGFLAFLMISSLSPDLLVYRAENDSYCQSIYWEPNAERKLKDVGCDLDVTTAQIMNIKSGRYE